MTTLIQPETQLPQTVYTGDIIQKVPVISQLNVNDLEPGQHRFFFQGVQMGTGQHWYVPVMVAKGIRAGKRIALTAGVHGDELSPVKAAQQVMAALDPTQMAGTVMAVYDLARPAKEYTQRQWPVAQKGGSLIDLNRVWPGNETGDDTPTRHAGLVWNRLFKPNVDIALDYHTASTGGDFTMFIFADLRRPEIRQLAELFPAEQIKDDPGEDGSLEMAFVQAGIPVLTVEIGGPRGFDRNKIAMAVEGSLNVLKHYQVMSGPLGRTSKEVGTFFGNAFETIRATTGGYLEMLVDLQDKVTPGQLVAIQRNSFGDVVAEYNVSVAGEVATITRDALNEPGSRLLQILYNRTELGG
ncbi:succinylglutamate desuccinylase/aspartoacylase family protein [Leptolyngbya sp. NK1-12]|uniref:Succinylglutamate desuccinylase/aspartoacylase family protein n=1 Tax=Leptolyngbya sp. NK1-12 TaxID=2547451 RepID=A0AA97AI12_9CYAN|nr:succinylglutamate desuccinylase/aspartoacylase family protein [Leptolyngbya sp. NK1-12]WNZ21542.1 succinylglutamate desuccinylase/aspartoacylase family protein [Leptolyngbya sp. NK1-12]